MSARLLSIVMTILSAASLWAVASDARAEIVHADGAATKVDDAPANVRTGRHESDSEIVVFAEAIGVSAEKPIKVDISNTGEAIRSDRRVGPKGRPKKKKKAVADWSPKTIPAGSWINSYYVHFDPVGAGKEHRTLSGSVTFQEEVLGIIVSTDKLLATNEFPGLKETKYPRGDKQGVEPNRNTRVALSPDRRTVSFTLPVSNLADNLRIITDGSPPGKKATKPKRKKNTGNKKTNAPAVDPFPVGSRWEGVRFDQFHNREFKCNMVVLGRKGNLVFMKIGERRKNALKMEWTFKIRKNRFDALDLQVTSQGHERITLDSASGATDGNNLEIQYLWWYSSTKPKGPKNSLQSGMIRLSRTE